MALIWANYGQQQVKAMQDAGAAIAYVNPKEGALAWLDTWAMTSGAKDPALAEDWINFLLDPEDRRRAVGADRLRQHRRALGGDRRERQARLARKRRGPDEALRPLERGQGDAVSEPAGRALVALQSVGKSYGTARVLHDVDLTVEDGEFLTILGPSGSGKTTILRLIGGFIAPSAGRIPLDGKVINDLPINRRPFNTVFQDYALFPHMTVRDNVGYGLSVRELPRAEIASRTARGAGPRAARPPGPPLPGAAVRRPAPARGARPRHRLRAASGAARRTARAHSMSICAARCRFS